MSCLTSADCSFRSRLRYSPSFFSRRTEQFSQSNTIGSSVRLSECDNTCTACVKRTACTVRLELYVLLFPSSETVTISDLNSGTSPKYRRTFCLISSCLMSRTTNGHYNCWPFARTNYCSFVRIA